MEAMRLAASEVLVVESCARLLADPGASCVMMYAGRGGRLSHKPSTIATAIIDSIISMSTKPMAVSNFASVSATTQSIRYSYHIWGTMTSLHVAAGQI